MSLGGRVLSPKTLYTFLLTTENYPQPYSLSHSGEHQKMDALAGFT